MQAASSKVRDACSKVRDAYSIDFSYTNQKLTTILHVYISVIEETLKTALELFQNGSLIVLFSPEEITFINGQICSQSNTVQFRLALEAVVKKREDNKIRKFLNK